MVRQGFGLLPQSPSSSDSATTGPNADEIVPGERHEDAIVGEPVDSGMDATFESGRFVECNYTHEGYDTTATMKSRELFRIDQHAQGGLAHVIRGPESTYLWVEGMTVADELDTDAYESQPAGRFPTFNPDDVDVADALDPDVCVELRDVDDALFTLPADMTSMPRAP